MQKKMVTLIKRLLKSTLLIMVVFIIILYIFRASKFYRIATDPDNIAEYAGWDIPVYEITHTGGNKCNTNCSQWCDYNYNLEFEKKLTKSEINKLKELTQKDRRWTYHKKENLYKFEYDMNNDYLLWNDDENISVNIKVYVNQQKAYLSYSWFESEVYIKWNKDIMMFDLVFM